MSDLDDLEREAMRRLWAGEAPLVGDLRIGERAEAVERVAEPVTAQLLAAFLKDWTAEILYGDMSDEMAEGIAQAWLDLRELRRYEAITETPPHYDLDPRPHGSV